MKRLAIFVLMVSVVYLFCGNAVPAAQQALWKAGVAKANITPQGPYCLAGFGGEKRIAKDNRHDLWIKVLALEDERGHRGLLVTSDICGFDRVSYDAICQGLKERCRLDRSQIILNFTHNHVGPVTRNSLMTFHAFTPQDLQQIDAYTKDIERKVVDAAVEAFRRMVPASVSLGVGKTNFAMNRRANSAEQVSSILCQGGELKGPVDHNLPVLAVRSGHNDLLAVVFAYSCHPVTTVESFFSGDFPGFAMLEVEKDHPGAMALFCQACGADQNPVFRGTIDTAHDYGRRLAAAVEDVLDKPMAAIKPVLDTADAHITLDYAQVVGREELEKAVRRASENVPAEERNIVQRKARWAREMLDELNAKGRLPAGYPYPLLAWRLGGNFLWIGLGGETVADYALTLRAKYGPNTIVTGYCGDLIGYIPSERVWKEGWGEEVEYLWEYSRPAYRWSGDIEQRILAAVDQLIHKLRSPAGTKKVSRQSGIDRLLLAVLGACAMGQTTTAASRSQSDSDQPRTTVIGYPSDGKPLARGEVTSMRDLNQAWRICSYTHRQLTPEKADEVAKRYAEAGFNLMISEGNRYLFWDKDKTPQIVYSLYSQPFADILRDTRLMSDACHKHGMKFFLHLTSTMVDASLLKEHPDWAAIDMATGKSPTNSYGTANTCFLNQDFMKAFYARLEQLINETRPDGMMLDEIQFFGYSLCGCRWCRETFHRDTGFELPSPAGWPAWAGTLSPGWKRWREWRREKAVEESKTYRALFKKHRPEGIISSYLCNPTTGYSFAAAGLVVDNLLHYADSVGYECEPHDLLYAYYWPHMIDEMKYQRAVAEDVGCAPWALFYNTSTRPGDYTINWLLAMSQGQRHWWLTEDRKYDRCWAFQVAWEARHEKLTMNQTSAANIGILFSQTSRDQACRSYGAQKREWIHGYAGTCNALTFGHVPYKAVIEEDLKAETLTKKLKTLVLFNTTSLSDSARNAVKEFVRTGGILLASGDASRYDTQWQVRPDFGLAEVFGLHYAGECAEDSRLVPEGRGAAVLGISEPIPHKYPFSLVKDLAADVTVLASMKTADGKTYPGLVTRRFGEGHVFYFSGHPELSYFFHYYNTNRIKPGEFWKDERDPAWGRLLCRIVQAENPGIPMTVENLPRGVVAEVYRQEFGGLKGVQVLLANFLGGEVAEGIIAAPADISFPSVRDHQPRANEPIRVAVRARGVKKVYLLSPDFDAVVELPFQEEGDLVRVKLPVLYRFAVLYFSQGSDAEILKAAGGRVVKAIPPARELVVDKAGAEAVGRSR